MLQPYKVAQTKETEEPPIVGSGTPQNLDNVQVEEVIEDEEEDDDEEEDIVEV